MKNLFFSIIIGLSLTASPAMSVEILISTGKPVTVNAHQETASNLTDGNTGTFWNSGSYSGWAQIDLQESILISKVIYHAWANPASSETIALRLNGEASYTMTRTLSVLQNTRTPVTLDFADRNARYVKLEVSAPGTWIACPEIQVYIDRTQEWVYTRDAGTAFGKNWTTGQTDALYQVYTTTHTSYKPSSDSETWYYNASGYDVNGKWGLAHTAGEYWTDKYGFKHIDIDSSGAGLTTFDKPAEWGYLAEAGYTDSFGDLFGQDWNYDEVQSLYDLWFSGRNGLAAPQYVEVDGVKWYYTGQDFAGYTLGDYWVDTEGNRFIYLGSGLTTLNPVPEPLTVSMLLLAVIGVIARRKMR
ncbi:MAG: discoidin domain-containing protein [Candidatus Auribacterota bacterium]